MARKVCPISGHPVDIFTPNPKGAQVRSWKGRWFSKMFEDVEDAFEWRNSFDLLKAIPKARREESPTSGKVRLVGDGWMTEFMEPGELAAWAPQPAKAKPGRPRKSQPQEEDAAAEESDKPAGS